MSTAALASLAEDRARYVAFVEKRVGSRALAEDIVQEAFVKSIERGGDIRDGESVVAWFYRVLRNAVIDHYRHSAVSAKALEQWAHELETCTEPTPEIETEICGCIGAGIEALKPEYREALQFADIEDRPLADLAAKANISESNAAVRVHRARQALRKRLSDCCSNCSDCSCS